MSKEYAKVDINDSSKNKRRMTAKEARELMTRKHYLEERVYEWIEQSCNCSESYITISSETFDADEIKYALDSLEKNGYTITKDLEQEYSHDGFSCKKVVIYKISW